MAEKNSEQEAEKEQRWEMFRDGEVKKVLRYVWHDGPRRVFRQMAGYWEDSCDEVAQTISREEYDFAREDLKKRDMGDMPDDMLREALQDFRVVDSPDVREALFDRMIESDIHPLRELNSFQTDVRILRYFMRDNFVSDHPTGFIDEIQELQNNLKVIERCIDCLGIFYNNVSLSSFGKLVAKSGGKLELYKSCLLYFAGIENDGRSAFMSSGLAADFLERKINKIISEKVAQGKRIVNEDFVSEFRSKARRGSATREVCRQVEEFMYIDEGISFDSLGYIPYSIAGSDLDNLFDPSTFSKEELEDLLYFWRLHFLLRPDYLYIEALSEQEVA